MRDDRITACIPVHRPRFNTTLPRALASVFEQTRPVDALAVATDLDHAGAACTRNRALDMVDTGWVAFLDSDDLWRPFHLEALEQHALATGADVVFPWFDVTGPGAFDPLAQWEGVPFDPAELETHNRIPVTVLARTDLLRDVGGFMPLGPPENPCDDWGCWRAVAAAGGKISHLNRRTWLWIWGNNTSGRGDRW